MSELPLIYAFDGVVLLRGPNLLVFYELHPPFRVKNMHLKEWKNIARCEKRCCMNECCQIKNQFWFRCQTLWPYHVQSISSRPITEVKQCRAWLKLGWETAWEHKLLLPFRLNSEMNKQLNVLFYCFQPANSTSAFLSTGKWTFFGESCNFFKRPNWSLLGDSHAKQCENHQKSSMWRHFWPF